jgi:imidazoleglycerol-phosphate dehydratase
MLELFGYHGYFDLAIEARGDIDVDEHHLVEDVGLVLGSAFSQALGTREGISRYASGLVPMDEVLVACAIDISGRPLFVLKVSNDRAMERRLGECFRDFFQSFCVNAGITLHMRILTSGGWHHVLEAMFKAFALTLDKATSLDARRREAPSTKGRLGEV